MAYFQNTQYQEKDEYGYGGIDKKEDFFPQQPEITRYGRCILILH